ncbi:MAG: hypothetical protein IID15_07900 [Candidatus Marinimicrobia bacterium]|nr:hypothetical protein [Candidatus Neomarinimicrobiota bacterium]
MPVLRSLACPYDVIYWSKEGESWVSRARGIYVGGINDNCRREVPGKKEYHLIFSELIAAAKYRGTVTYQEIAQILGLPLTGNYMGAEIGHLLGEISEDEVRAARPMLSAIVVNTAGKPGPGFFELARQLGKLDTDERKAELRFFEAERKEVYDQWKVKLE